MPCHRPEMVLKPLSKAAKTGAKSFVPIRVYQAQETRSLRHGGARKRSHSVDSKWHKLAYIGHRPRSASLLIIELGSQALASLCQCQEAGWSWFCLLLKNNKKGAPPMCWPGRKNAIKVRKETFLLRFWFISVLRCWICSCFFYVSKQGPQKKSLSCL